MHAPPGENSAGFTAVVLATGGRMEVPGDTVLTSVTLDSRSVEPGALFAALPGHRTHGRAFIADAVARGAAAIITDDRGAEIARAQGVPVAVYDDPRASLADICRVVYGASDGITLLGVTGTNGKTSVAFMMAGGLRASGIPSALIGTLGINIGESWRASMRTTPEAPELHRLFRECRDTGIDHAVMEVSSIAATESRVRGLTFSVMVFTNLSQDHLDYHGSMEAYYQAKRSLFAGETARQAVVCVDTEWGLRLAEDVDVPVITVATEGRDADWTAEFAGGWQVRGPGFLERGNEMLPAFVVANRLCATAALHACGVAAHHAWTAVGDVAVPGRMEMVEQIGGVNVWVDYAHTPEAVARALRALRDSSSGRLITVVGAGGERDADKRGAMGRSAAEHSDVVIVTDDNPRSEDPALIRTAVIDGARGVVGPHIEEVAPRAEAIHAAIRAGRPGDVVAILGKGAETYQEIGGIRHPFDDRDVVRRLARELRT